MALSPSQRDLVGLVRRAVEAVDRVHGRFWEDIRRILASVPGGPVLRTMRRSLMDRIDRVINRVFGATQAAALTSDLFRTLLISTDQAAVLPFRRAVDRVRSLVERTSPSWWQRIRRQASPEQGDGFLRVLAALDGDEVARQRILRSRLLDPQRRWVDPQGYRLSDRVWRTGRTIRRQIDARLVEGIRNGEDALDIAADLERYLKPEHAPVTYRANGQVVRVNQTATPGRGGYGGTASRRLARTEVTRVFGQATIEAAKVTPGVLGVRWELSGSHPSPDRCDDNAIRDAYELGPGVYPPGDVPQYPSHPQDLCTLSMAMKRRSEVLDDLVRRYGAAEGAAA